VWVTAPHDKTIFVLDVSNPGTPKLAGNFKVEGQPEGYAVDDAHGVFYTNLEDTDRTLKVDIKTHRVLATWMPSCGEDGPKGLAFEPAGQVLIVACPDHIEAMDATAGKIVSKLDTGAGVDNIDYVPSQRLVYVGAAGAGTLTVAHVEKTGTLKETARRTTAKGARNAVATEDGVAYLANGPAGTVVVVTSSKAH
jgi:hypothetical protein